MQKAPTPSRRCRPAGRPLAAIALVLALALPASGVESDLVQGFVKLSDPDLPAIQNGSQFGMDAAGLGEVDGDDFVDVAVGAIEDSFSGSQSGAVWILYLDGAGGILSSRRWNEQDDPNDAFALEAGPSSARASPTSATTTGTATGSWRSAAAWPIRRAAGCRTTRGRSGSSTTTRPRPSR